MQTFRRKGEEAQGIADSQFVVYVPEGVRSRWSRFIQRKLQQQIDALDKKMRAEKQPRVKRELYDELQALKEKKE